MRKVKQKTWIANRAIIWFRQYGDIRRAILRAFSEWEAMQRINQNLKDA